MSDREKNRTELRKEIKIAIFWRKLIGDFEYVKFNPDDVLRWHIALEMRGPEEMRDLIAERYMTQARRTPVVGLVGEAPHPPIWMVREWLGTKQPKFPKWRGLSLMLVLVVICALLLPTIHGCENLQPMNPLVMNPVVRLPAVVGSTLPAISTPPAFQPNPVPSFTNTVPAVGNMLSGGTSPRVSSPQMGVAPPSLAPGSSGAGSTGTSTTPTNSGISGGTPP